MKNKITLETWFEEMISDMNRFKAHWKSEMQKGNPNFPERIGKGDWDEQFNIFTDIKSNE
jgi:hypothetical protein